MICKKNSVDEEKIEYGIVDFTTKKFGVADVSKVKLSGEDRTTRNWTEISVPEVICLPDEKPPIESIDQVSVIATVNKSKLIETPFAYDEYSKLMTTIEEHEVTSQEVYEDTGNDSVDGATTTVTKTTKTTTVENLEDPATKFFKIIGNKEGGYLSGRKLIVEGILNHKFVYTADVSEQSVHSFKYDVPFSAFIIPYAKFEGADGPKTVEDLFSKDLSKINPKYNNGETSIYKIVSTTNSVDNVEESTTPAPAGDAIPYDKNTKVTVYDDVELTNISLDVNLNTTNVAEQPITYNLDKITVDTVYEDVVSSAEFKINNDAVDSVSVKITEPILATTKTPATIPTTLTKIKLEDEFGKDTGWYFTINDSGSITLYDKNGKEIYTIVSENITADEVEFEITPNNGNKYTINIQNPGDNSDTEGAISTVTAENINPLRTTKTEIKIGEDLTDPDVDTGSVTINDVIKDNSEYNEQLAVYYDASLLPKHNLEEEDIVTVEDVYEYSTATGINIDIYEEFCVEPYIEDIYVAALDEYSLFKNVALFLHAKPIKSKTLYI